jgi:hypothetical protein
MATKSFEVKYYRVFLGTGTINSVHIVGYLNCLDADVNWSYQQTVYFVPEGSSLPPAWYNPSAKSGGIYRPISQMGLYLDFLRNEKPVYASMDDQSPDGNALRTFPEAVGEGE